MVRRLLFVFNGGGGECPITVSGLALVPTQNLIRRKRKKENNFKRGFFKND